MVRSSDSQYAAAGTDPPWPPLLKGGKLTRNIRGGKPPLPSLQVFNRPPWPPLLKGGKVSRNIFNTPALLFPCWGPAVRYLLPESCSSLSAQSPSGPSRGGWAGTCNRSSGTSVLIRVGDQCLQVQVGILVRLTQRDPNHRQAIAQRDRDKLHTCPLPRRAGRCM